MLENNLNFDLQFFINNKDILDIYNF